jgi:hypothetical protein
MYANITASELQSLMSLHIFSGTDKVTPILSHLQITRSDDQLTVLTTDRYCLARGVYPVDTIHDPDETDGTPDETDGTVYLSLDTIKSFFPIVKKERPNTMVTVTDWQITVHGMTDTIIPVGQVTSTFPPVDRLIPDDVDAKPEEPAGLVSLNPQFVAKLAKVLLPIAEKHDSSRPWRFTIGTEQNAMGNPKPAPVLCVPMHRDEQPDIVVMIQPNLLTR